VESVDAMVSNATAGEVAILVAEAADERSFISEELARSCGVKNLDREHIGQHSAIMDAVRRASSSYVKGVTF